MNTLKAILCIFLFCALCSSASIFAAENKREMIIDTDVGADDAIAILYLLKNPTVKVSAITIEGDGNAHCVPAFYNVQGLLALVKQPAIPVACGRDTPLMGQHRFPAAVLAAGDRLEGAVLKKPSMPMPNINAALLLAETLQRAQKAVDILAIGPLTTLAEVLMQHPELKQKIHRIYIMGGAINVPGNIRSVVPTSENRVAEWNIYIDPFAADKVFHSGIAITLVPLDVTNKVLIDEHFYQQVKAMPRTPAAEFLVSLLQHNTKMMTDKLWYFWDPMAAVIALHENIASCNSLPVSVRLSPESLSGQVWVDRKHGALLRVCMDIDASKFNSLLLNSYRSTG